MSAPIIIAGASGYIGTNLLARLDPTTSVACISRSRPDNHLGLQPKDYIFLHYDNAVRGELTGLNGFKGGTLVHLIGAGRGTRPLDIWEANVASTKMLTDMAFKLRLSRIIYLSGFGIPSNSSSSYYQAKQHAERIIVDSGLRYLILRCSYIVGRQDEITPDIIAGAIRGHCEIPGGGEYQIQPVFIDDLVSVIVAALHNPAHLNEFIDVIGEAVSFGAFVRRLLKRLGIACEVHSRNVEEFIRDAVLSDRPSLSLDELAILLADVVGSPSQQVYGVKIRNVEAIIESIATQWNNYAR